MREAVAELFPQVFVIIVAITGAFGSASAKSRSASTQALVDFIQAGGGDGDAVREAASAHATGLLSISAFVAAFLTVFLDAMFALFTGGQGRDILLGVIALAVLEFFIFAAILMAYRPFELALNLVTRLGGRSKAFYLNLRPATLLDIGTYGLLGLALVVGAIKVWPAPAKSAHAAQAVGQLRAEAVAPPLHAPPAVGLDAKTR